MRIVIQVALVLALFAGPCCARANADGGQIRVMQTFGDYRLTVFTSPTPLRSGPIDVSVMVQDALTGQVVPDVNVTVELSHLDESMLSIRTTATAAAATNKLLQAALVDIPTPGKWNVHVVAAIGRDHAPLEVAFHMEASPPLPRWLTVWPWFTWPFVVVALFAVHRARVACHRPRSAVFTQ